MSPYNYQKCHLILRRMPRFALDSKRFLHGNTRASAQTPVTPPSLRRLAIRHLSPQCLVFALRLATPRLSPLSCTFLLSTRHTPSLVSLTAQIAYIPCFLLHIAQATLSLHSRPITISPSAHNAHFSRYNARYPLAMRPRLHSLLPYHHHALLPLSSPNSTIHPRNQIPHFAAFHIRPHLALCPEI